MSTKPGFEIKYVWYLSVLSVLVQATTNIILLLREFKKKLNFADAVSPAAVATDMATAMTSVE